MDFTDKPNSNFQLMRVNAVFLLGGCFMVISWKPIAFYFFGGRHFVDWACLMFELLVPSLCHWWMFWVQNASSKAWINIGWGRGEVGRQQETGPMERK